MEGDARGVEDEGVTRLTENAVDVAEHAGLYPHIIDHKFRADPGADAAASGIAFSSCDFQGVGEKSRPVERIGLNRFEQTGDHRPVLGGPVTANSGLRA
jgi:hypothetical protein